MKTVKIGNEVFEVIKKRGGVPRLNTRYSNIYSAYESPSYSKVNIWHYWNNFAYEYGLSSAFITGNNCQTFTINFELENPETGEAGLAVITKAHNRLYV